jgi:hypothetical protein
MLLEYCQGRMFAFAESRADCCRKTAFQRNRKVDRSARDAGQGTEGSRKGVSRIRDSKYETNNSSLYEKAGLGGIVTPLWIFQSGKSTPVHIIIRMTSLAARSVKFKSN